MEKVIQVAAGIMRRADQILVCQRRITDPHPGKWEFPGGKLEPGESPEACLRREIAEELGVDATIGESIAHHRHSYRGGPTVDLWFFEVASFAGELRNRVFAEVRWVALDELPTIDLLEADRPVVTQLRRLIPSGA